MLKKEGFNKAVLVFISLFVLAACELMPRNTLKDCRMQCEDKQNPQACYDFCDCIHKQAGSLDSCLEVYKKKKEK